MSEYERERLHDLEIAVGCIAGVLEGVLDVLDRGSNVIYVDREWLANVRGVLHDSIESVSAYL